jgi:hypothetical protein
MDTPPGNTLSFEDEIRRELDDLLNRLGRVIGRRLTEKGISEPDGFLKVAEALVEFARHRPQIEAPDRWLIEYLKIGPYDPAVLAREIEEERNMSDLDRRARATEARRRLAMERQRQLWADRRPGGGSRPHRPSSKRPWNFWTL